MAGESNTAAPPATAVVRLGTRGSLLARTQSQLVASELEAAHPGIKIELSIFKTSGDRIVDRPLHEFGGKGLFVKELEQALLTGQVDFVVHSYKDVPVTMPLVPEAQGHLVVAATPPRADARDVLVRVDGLGGLDELPPGARVGTGSLRRRCQVLAARPDVRVEGLRGNIDSRLRKLREGEFDAVLLAAAGVMRAGLFDRTCMALLDEMCSAPGQGALALQCRAEDAPTRQLLAALHDPVTAACVKAERAVVLGLNGDCHSPIAARAVIEAGILSIVARVGGRDGVPPVLEASASAPASQAADAVDRVLARLKEQGAAALLAG